MSFSLDFIALNFSSPLRTVYRYRLENFDDKWITTGLDEGAGVQHVSYTNLPPNRYRFVVSASTGGEQFGEEAVVEILVLPPWWMARAMIVAYGVLALLAVAGGGLWLRRRIGRAHREQIASITRKNKLDLLEAKVSLFTEVANEIRTPVALIAAPVEQIAKRAGDLPGLRDDVDIIRKNCERLRTLVDQILNLKSAEEGEHAASRAPERVDVREVLRTVVAAVGDAVPRRGIAVHLGLPGEALTAEMCCDHFSKIVGQILGNAYQFAESRIDITLEGPGGEVPGDVFRVRVRDDGAGIDRAEKARIFEPFYTSDKCVSGSGLGLAVAKSLATRMGAVLGVESAVGQWTEFTVTVPLGAPRPVPGSDGDSGVPAGQPAVAAVQPEVQKRLPDILLAEDNADFADFFVRHLSGSYTIHCATNGRQALDLLRSRGIAAVVSDVAMKGMDGVALCAAIRNDPALDHLPVVLVSVDSSSAAKVRALEAGADAYLEKPLSVDYLDRQIRALIDIRGRLRLKFSKMPYLVMDGDAASPSGNRFMAQVNQYVMDNISNSNLSVEDIAAAVNVSRTLFFSRIKSLTGTTPNEFLRSTRLRVAAELLSKPNDLRVTEICYMVGFTSTSYFAKCFHAQFGMLPTEFMEKYRRE